MSIFNRVEWGAKDIGTTQIVKVNCTQEGEYEMGLVAQLPLCS